MRKPLMLDTCALLWLASGSERISNRVRLAIDSAPAVYVSAISAWEVSLGVARKEIDLPMDPLKWFHQAIQQHNLTLADLTPEVLCRANALPWHHRDPADRFIIATANLMRMAIVTADARFAAYGVEVCF